MEKTLFKAIVMGERHLNSDFYSTETMSRMGRFFRPPVFVNLLFPKEK